MRDSPQIVGQTCRRRVEDVERKDAIAVQIPDAPWWNFGVNNAIAIDGLSAKFQILALKDLHPILYIGERLA